MRFKYDIISMSFLPRNIMTGDKLANFIIIFWILFFTIYGSYSISEAIRPGTIHYQYLAGQAYNISNCLHKLNKISHNNKIKKFGPLKFREREVAGKNITEKMWRSYRHFAIFFLARNFSNHNLTCHEIPS